MRVIFALVGIMACDFINRVGGRSVHYTSSDWSGDFCEARQSNAPATDSSGRPETSVDSPSGLLTNNSAMANTRRTTSVNSSWLCSVFTAAIVHNLLDRAWKNVMPWIVANQGPKTQILYDQKVSRNRPDFFK
jgi:hypothetical protein